MADIPEDINKFLSGIPATQLPEFCSAVHCPFSTNTFLTESEYWWGIARIVRVFSHGYRPSVATSDQLTSRDEYERLMKDNVPYVDLCTFHLDVLSQGGSDRRFSMSPPDTDRWQHLGEEG